MLHWHRSLLPVKYRQPLHLLLLPESNIALQYTVAMSQRIGPLNILVVGAGLGGLATALALQTDGHNVTAIDSAAAFGEVRNLLPTRPLITASKEVSNKVSYSRSEPESTCHPTRAVSYSAGA